MTNKNEIYKCEICGNIIEVLHQGAAALVCCNQPMKLQKENTIDAATEKHIPVVEINNGNEVHVKVGEVEHPSEEKHYIEWIEVITNKRVYRRDLDPGSKPESKFMLRASENVESVRAYCNLHGLWKSE